MKYLDLTECKVRPVTLGSPGNGDECLLDLTSHCYDLEKLSLAKLNLSNPKWLENIVQNSLTLRVLDLGYCTGSSKAKYSMDFNTYIIREPFDHRLPSQNGIWKKFVA